MAYSQQGPIREILIDNSQANTTPAFQVDTSADYVFAYQLPGTTPFNASSFCSSGAAASTTPYLNATDAVHIVGYGLYLPYNFSLADQALINFPAGGVPGPNFAVPTLNIGALTFHSPYNYQLLPMANGLPIMKENTYYCCDIFVNAQILAQIGYSFSFISSMCTSIPNTSGPGGTCNVAAISMLNVPSWLNTKILYARPFIDIIHSIPMGAAV
jgi:hypothetical protein